MDAAEEEQLADTCRRHRHHFLKCRFLRGGTSEMSVTRLCQIGVDVSATPTYSVSQPRAQTGPRLAPTRAHTHSTDTHSAGHTRHTHTESLSLHSRRSRAHTSDTHTQTTDVRIQKHTCSGAPNPSLSNSLSLILLRSRGNAGRRWRVRGVRHRHGDWLRAILLGVHLLRVCHRLARRNWLTVAAAHRLSHRDRWLSHRWLAVRNGNGLAGGVRGRLGIGVLLAGLRIGAHGHLGRRGGVRLVRVSAV